MRGRHTVEKIGGTSMTRFKEVMDNVIIGKRTGADLYNRVFVVSAYGGITNLLLENKKNGAPGVYGRFARGEDWESALELVRSTMLELNQSFEPLGLNVAEANDFINQRLDEVHACIRDLVRLFSYGHFKQSDYLPPSREILAAIGEVHSAYNSTQILQAHGINATFVDLSGWMDTGIYSFDEMLRRHFDEIDYDHELPIVTGYVKFNEGIMRRFDRGYSEITFSKIAVITNAREGIIHKEYHLSTGDPVLIGPDRVKVIGNINFDIADQLADLDMEAIHSKASKEMELCDIPIRIKNAFEPEHPGTLIARDFVSPIPKVDIICGRDDLIALEITDPEMVGLSGYDHRLLAQFYEKGISYIAKNVNANTITHFVHDKDNLLPDLANSLSAEFTGAAVTLRKVAIVCAIGSNMKDSHIIARAVLALANEDIDILALGQTMPRVNLQFIIDPDQFDAAQFVLHRTFFE
ncbi:MAG TPA: aspartate kinase [Verrucomicrobia bacterium]|jgi:aspartate kinase|nr:aspartate kinase [Verrucomicrobiota bacterium]